MMKVKLITGRCGDDGNGRSFIQNPGDEIEVNAELGKRMIEAGQAVYVSGTKPTKEKADPEPDAGIAAKTQDESAKTESGDGKPVKTKRGKRAAT